MLPARLHALEYKCYFSTLPRQIKRKIGGRLDLPQLRLEAAARFARGDKIS
jgi:hypothetical protein